MNDRTELLCQSVVGPPRRLRMPDHTELAIAFLPSDHAKAFYANCSLGTRADWNEIISAHEYFIRLLSATESFDTRISVCPPTALLQVASVSVVFATVTSRWLVSEPALLPTNCVTVPEANCWQQTTAGRSEVSEPKGITHRKKTHKIPADEG